MNLKHLLSFGLILISAFAFSQLKPVTVEKGIKLKVGDEGKIGFSFRAQNLFIAQGDNQDSETDLNFLVRRMRLKSSGMFTSKFGYKMELGLSNRDIGASKDFEQVNSASRIVLDAVVKYKPINDLELWFGQTKLPGNRERIISSSRLQLVDRSLVNSRFNIDRDMGAQLYYKPTIGTIPVSLGLAISQGEGRNITKGNYGGLSYSSRLEFFPLGKFTKKGGAYITSDLGREEKPKLAIGFAYNLNQGAVRQGGQLGSFVYDTLGNMFENDLTTIFADLIFKYRGWSVLAEYAQKNQQEINTLVAQTLTKQYNIGSGYTAQVGYLFKNNYEVTGRYTSISPVTNESTALVTENQYTIGLSKYIIKHKIKWQTDFSLNDLTNKQNWMYRFQVEIGI